jgi:predicted nucleotidyltransferase
MSPDGINIGGGTRWMREATERADDRTLPDGRVVRVVTPPYFVVLKLAAFLDRGEDLISSKDIEDLVCIAVEVDDLAEQVTAAGLRATVASLWQDVFGEHQVDATYIGDLVASHLHPSDADRSALVEKIIGALVGGSVASR